MNDYQTFSLTIENNIARLEFSRPHKLNSMTPTFWQEFPEAIRFIDQEASARVLVISSQGDHFCAGMDLSVFETLLNNDSQTDIARERLNFRERVLQFQNALTTVEQCRIPVIAAIQGACIGGGVALASVCDMRYSTADAFFSIEEINIGIACDIGTLQRLPYQISETHLREWVYSGQRISADKAEKWGFIGQTYESYQDMLKSVNALAETIANKSPVALHGSKVSMNYNRDHSVQEGLDHIAFWSSAMLHEEEINEAMDARSKQRPANFDPLLPKA